MILITPQVSQCSSAVDENGVCLPPIAISVAMDLNRGFGSNGVLPWPPIKYFILFTSIKFSISTCFERNMYVRI